QPDPPASGATPDSREGQPGRATEGARVALREARREGREQLVLFSAQGGRPRRDAGPAGQPLERDLRPYARGRSELSRVAGKPVRDVDQGACTAARQPAPGGDAGCGAREAPEQRARQPGAAPTLQGGERQPGAAEPARHPMSSNDSQAVRKCTPSRERSIETARVVPPSRTSAASSPRSRAAAPSRAKMARSRSNSPPGPRASGPLLIVPAPPH